MNARLYDPALGRFLSPDPYVQAPDFSQSFNRYSYCLNNPLRYGDPTGEYAVIDDIISMALGGIYNVVTNWGNINSIGQGFAFFGVGVVGGAVSLYGSPLAGAAVLSVGNNVLSQGFSKGWDNINFDQVAIAGVMGVATSYLGGQVGGVLSKPIDKLTSGIASPVLRDMATQSLTNGGTGFVLSTTLSLGSGSSFEDAISAGGQSALTGLGIGAMNGTISGFRYAHENNLNPWDGLSNERPTMQRLGTPDIGGQSKIDINAEDLHLSSTVARINSGGSYNHKNDGTIFQNNKNILPEKPAGYYKEFVHPTPGLNGPGAQRIVIGGGNKWYYSPDHYKTFIRFNPK